MAFSVDNGWMMKFWKDKWRGDRALGNSYPALFASIDSKNVCMKMFDM